jgi:GntR family transcriptional regulator
VLADQGNGLPHYQNVRQQLRADLESGRWKPGDMLPTEAELARHFELSVGTIRQAVLSLVREGLLTRRPGRGTFVARFDTGNGFGRFFHFREDLRDKVVPSVHHIDTVVLEKGDLVTAGRLRIAPRAPLYRVRRVLLGNGEPICLYTSYLDKKRFPGLEVLDLEDSRLYAELEKHYGVHVRGAEEILRAGSPDAEEAGHLGITPSTPVMVIERTALGSQGSVIEWRRTVGRSDQFHYKITLP